MKQPTAPIYPELPTEDGKTTHQVERCEEGLIQKV